MLCYKFASENLEYILLYIYRTEQIGINYHLPHTFKKVEKEKVDNNKKFRGFWDNNTIFNNLNQYYPITYTSKIGNQLFKHKMCLSIERTGKCPLNDKCLFAHISFITILNQS